MRCWGAIVLAIWKWIANWIVISREREFKKSAKDIWLLLERLEHRGSQKGTWWLRKEVLRYWGWKITKRRTKKGSRLWEIKDAAYLRYRGASF